jgi:hypothetical protein
MTMSFKEFLNEAVTWKTYKNSYILGKISDVVYVANNPLLDFSVGYVDGAWRVEDPNGDEWDSGFKSATAAKKAVSGYIEDLTESSDLDEAYAVYRKGGSIGSQGGEHHPVHGTFVSKHDTPEEAK